MASASWSASSGSLSPVRPVAWTPSERSDSADWSAFWPASSIASSAFERYRVNVRKILRFRRTAREREQARARAGAGAAT